MCFFLSSSSKKQKTQWKTVNFQFNLTKTNMRFVSFHFNSYFSLSRCVCLCSVYCGCLFVRLFFFAPCVSGGWWATLRTIWIRCVSFIHLLNVRFSSWPRALGLGRAILRCLTFILTHTHTVDVFVRLRVCVLWVITSISISLDWNLCIFCTQHSLVQVFLSLSPLIWVCVRFARDQSLF